MKMHIWGSKSAALGWKGLTNEAAICEHAIKRRVVLVGTRFLGSFRHWICGGAGHGRRERADAEQQGRRCDQGKEGTPETGHGAAILSKLFCDQSTTGQTCPLRSVSTQRTFGCPTRRLSGRRRQWRPVSLQAAWPFSISSSVKRAEGRGDVVRLSRLSTRHDRLLASDRLGPPRPTRRA